LLQVNFAPLWLENSPLTSCQAYCTTQHTRCGLGATQSRITALIAKNRWAECMGTAAHCLYCSQQHSDVPCKYFL